MEISPLNSRHFLFDGLEHPRGYLVVEQSNEKALLVRDGFPSIRVLGNTVVGGSVPANQAALIAALTAIVSLAADGGASASDIGAAVGNNLRTAPPPTNHGITSIGHGLRTNAAAGTALPLTAASTPAKWVAVQAHENNAGIIVIGGAGVTVAGGGLALSPGGSATIPVPGNLNAVFFDSILAGGVVRFTWFN